jgi:hypothetical protein
VLTSYFERCSKLSRKSNTVPILEPANWPWIVGYSIAAIIIFVYLRRTSSTDALAASATRDLESFGAPIRLLSVARQFLRLDCPRLLTILVAMAWAVRLTVGQWTAWDALAGLGIVAFWPIQEWIIHVFLLHLKPFSWYGWRIDPIVARNHRNHHLNPWHAELGITPAHIIWFYLSALPAAWLLMLPAPVALTGIAVYFSLVLNYEWIHYLIHTSSAPKSRISKRLWRNHRLHHFKNEHFWYGVTMLTGDRLLQTQPPANKTPRSETCLTLGVERELADWTTFDNPDGSVMRSTETLPAPVAEIESI